MTILEYVDIDNMEHLAAIRYLFKKGVWPKNFLSKVPEGTTFNGLWHMTLAYKLAEKYLDETIKEKL